jgi:hypothetical protein
MRHRYWRWALVLGIAVFGLTACSEVSEVEPASEGDSPALIEPVEGSDGLSRITLTEQAAERLDLTTATVAESSARGGGTTIPYGAVMYDENGETWTYTEEEPLVYLRASITVASIDGDVATLDAGPPVGTPVVTVGAAELYGAEVGVDH